MSIRKKLLRSIFLINGMLLFVTCITFFLYELYSSRKRAVDKISTIGEIISVNSTAALAFYSHEDATEILSALKKEKNIVGACLYDQDGKIFAQYRANSDSNRLPSIPGSAGYRFINGDLEGFQRVEQDGKLQGTLYLKSNMGTLHKRMRLYAIIWSLVIIISFLLAHFLSKILLRNILVPILSLAKTAIVISDQKDYSVRAKQTGNDEVGLLTNAFNQMLEQIEKQDHHLSEFNQKLEQKVKERTIQLETVNKELEAFSYSVSHDLRAPLRGVIGFTAILEQDYSDKLDGEAKRLTGKIRSNTLKMGNLIDDLLSFSRMSRMDIVKNRINTSELVKNVIAELDQKQNITWHIEPLRDSIGDLNTIRQVWINLISNAIKYSRNVSKPCIEIGSFKAAGVTFFVKDNGVGFDEQYKDKLFKVFQRLHSTNEFEGTGVGLAIVEKIVSKHGGKVWAEGEKNVGASFYFSLPVR